MSRELRSIQAALRPYDSRFRNDFMAKVEKASPSAQGRLLAIYDVAEAWFSQKDFFGCLFVTVASDFPDCSSPIQQTSYEFKRLMRLYVKSLCDQLDILDPDGLANELSLLLEGATVTAQVSGNPQAARVARKMAKTMIAEAMV